MLTNRRFGLAVFIWCCVSINPNLAPLVAAEAQEVQQPEDVVFDVASIRLNTSESDLAEYRISPRRYTATRLSLVDLILQAYGIKRFQLVGGPAWMRTERFDIAATATGELTRSGARPTLPVALRRLLQDRFRLVVHTESRNFPVYSLSVAREGRLGPKISASNTDCASIPLHERARQCSVSAPGAYMQGQYFAMSAPISHLVGSLGVDRPVIDETGLEGNYKIELNWTPAQSARSIDSVASVPSERGPIFTAIQEQLGLRLDATTAPFPVLVIDAVEYPTKN